MREDSKSPRPLRVFLCHSSRDKQVVRDLFGKLQAEGIDAWLDEEKILPGQDWRQEISKAMRAADVVLICVSRESVGKAGYVQKEIKYALDVAEQQPEGTIFLIPVKLEECKIPDRLNRWQWVDLHKETGYDRLVRALRARANELKSTERPNSEPSSDAVTGSASGQANSPIARASILKYGLVATAPAALILAAQAYSLTKVEASGMWKAISYVTSGLGLVAFIVAVGAWVYNRQLKSKESLIKTANAEDRPELIKELPFPITTSALTPDKQYDLAIAQLEARERKSRRNAILATVLAFFLLVLSVFVIQKMRSQDTSGNSPRLPGATTTTVVVGKKANVLGDDLTISLQKAYQDQELKKYRISAVIESPDALPLIIEDQVVSDRFRYTYKGIYSIRVLEANERMAKFEVVKSKSEQ